MQAAANIPARSSSRFWRLLFWFTLIHLILVGFIVVGFFQLQSFRTLRTFHPKQLGLINSSTTMTYILDTNVVWPLLIWDAIFILPPLLILARLIFRGWPTREPGLCAGCGYDLTGNISGTCPECGTPLNERR